MHTILATWFKRYFSDPEAISIIIIFALIVLAIKVMDGIFTPIIISIMVAYVLSGLVKKMRTWHIPNMLGIIVAFLIFLGILLWFLLWLFPLMWQQLLNLVNSFPGMVNQAQNLLLNMSSRYPDIINVDQLRQLASGINVQVSNLGKLMFTFSVFSITSIITIIIYLILIPLLVFFFLKDNNVILNWFSQFLPKKRHAIQTIWKEVNSKIGSYIEGKFIEMLLVAVVSVVTFALFGLQYAILLGVLVGISVIIPYVGIIIVTAPIVVIGFVEWGMVAHFLYLLVAYSIIVILDANVLVPMLFSGVLNLHPVAIILAVLLFGIIGGFWGVFFAIPLTVLGNALIKNWPRV